MKPEVIKADVGCMVKFPHDDEVYYVGELVGDGNCYQSKQAFKDNQGICYIDKYGWFDEVGWDENVPDEMYDWMMRHPKYSGVTFGGTGYTRDDLRDVVYDWADTEALDDVAGDSISEFIDYFTGVLFANLVNGKPEDKIQDYDPWEEYQIWLQVTDDDPRLTPEQRKELGYE